MHTNEHSDLEIYDLESEEDYNQANSTSSGDFPSQEDGGPQLIDKMPDKDEGRLVFSRQTKKKKRLEQVLGFKTFGTRYKGDEWCSLHKLSSSNRDTTSDRRLLLTS